MTQGLNYGTSTVLIIVIVIESFDHCLINDCVCSAQCTHQGTQSARSTHIGMSREKNEINCTLCGVCASH